MSIYLHIGVGKTGTSSLQRFLLHFNNEVEAQGFHILKTGCDPQMAAHHLLALSFGFSKKNNDEFSEEVYRALREEILLAGQKNIIISSENFHSHVTETKLQNLRRTMVDQQVKIILYVRRQDEWIDSAYRQFSEMDNIHTVEQIIEKAIKNRAIDYEWQVDKWESCFGEGSIILRVYQSGQLKRDTVHDFAQIIGLELTAEMKQFDLQSNPSISAAQAEILRIVNCVSANKKNTRDAVLQVLRADTSIDDSKYHYMSDRTREGLLSYYAEGNAKLAKKYFGRADGCLFDGGDKL